MTIIITSNVRSLVADFERIAKEMPEAIASALNKTAAQVKTAAAREIRARGYTLKASTVKDGIRIERANRGKLTARVIVNRHIQQAIRRLIEEKFPRILAHEIAWFTKKRGGVA
jgi:Prophage minor tail protein Z (GPZ)